MPNEKVGCLLIVNWIMVWVLFIKLLDINLMLTFEEKIEYN